jgi:hypothetical protein
VAALSLKWRQYKTPGGIEIALFEESTAEVGSYGRIQTVSSSLPEVRVALQYGPDQTLAWLRSDMTALPAENVGVRFGVETEATVCGRPARRQEAEIPTQPIREGVFRDGSHRSSQAPAEHQVAVAFEVGALKFLAIWIVRASERARYENDEQHFFASIRCPSP